MSLAESWLSSALSANLSAHAKHQRREHGRFAPEGGGLIPRHRVDMEIGRPAGGSNGARWAKGPGGHPWIVKPYARDKSPRDRIATELVSNAIYRAMGARVPEAGLSKVSLPSTERDIKDVPLSDDGHLKAPKKKRVGSGMVLRTPDGRVVLRAPKNGFGGYDWSHAKGGRDHGHTLQQNAHKEVREETGLHAQIHGVVGDFEGDTSVTRFYHGTVAGGEMLKDDLSPYQPGGNETEKVRVVTPEQAMKMLNRQRDRDVLQAALAQPLPPSPPGGLSSPYPPPRSAMAVAYRAEEGKPIPYVFHDQGPSADVGRHYMADALLGNWDVAGMHDDNVLWRPDGAAVRIDQGGTLEFRAMGAKKPFGPVPVEVRSMMKKGAQGRRSSLVDDDAMQEQALEVEKRLTPAVIDSILDSAPFADDEMRERVRESLKSRVAWMGRFGRGEVGPPEMLAESAEMSEHRIEEALHLHDFFWDHNKHPRDQHGKFIHTLNDMKPGHSLKLGEHTRVTRMKDGTFTVQRSQVRNPGFTDPADAARNALDRAVKVGFGGQILKGGFNEYLKHRALDPDNPNFLGGVEHDAASLHDEVDALQQRYDEFPVKSAQHKRSRATVKARLDEAKKKYQALGGTLDAEKPSPPKSPVAKIATTLPDVGSAVGSVKDMDKMPVGSKVAIGHTTYAKVDGTTWRALGAQGSWTGDTQGFVHSVAQGNVEVVSYPETNDRHAGLNLGDVPIGSHVRRVGASDPVTLKKVGKDKYVSVTENSTWTKGEEVSGQQGTLVDDGKWEIVNHSEPEPDGPSKASQGTVASLGPGDWLTAKHSGTKYQVVAHGEVNGEKTITLKNAADGGHHKTATHAGLAGGLDSGEWGLGGKPEDHDPGLKPGVAVMPGHHHTIPAGATVVSKNAITGEWNTVPWTHKGGGEFAHPESGLSKSFDKPVQVVSLPGHPPVAAPPDAPGGLPPGWHVDDDWAKAFSEVEVGQHFVVNGKDSGISIFKKTSSENAQPDGSSIAKPWMDVVPSDGVIKTIAKGPRDTAATHVFHVFLPGDVVRGAEIKNLPAGTTVQVGVHGSTTEFNSTVWKIEPGGVIATYGGMKHNAFEGEMTLKVVALPSASSSPHEEPAPQSFHNVNSSDLDALPAGTVIQNELHKKSGVFYVKQSSGAWKKSGDAGLAGLGSTWGSSEFSGDWTVISGADAMEVAKAKSSTGLAGPDDAAEKIAALPEKATAVITFVDGKTATFVKTGDGKIAVATPGNLKSFDSAESAVTHAQGMIGAPYNSATMDVTEGKTQKPAKSIKGLQPVPVDPSYGDGSLLPHMLKSLDIAPGDLIQKMKGGHKLKVVGPHGAYLKVETPKGKTKYIPLSARYASVQKADGSQVSLKHGEDAPAQKVMSPAEIKAALKPPTVDTPVIGDLKDGVVIETPDGKVAVLKPQEDAYEGYVKAYDVNTGSPFEPPKKFQPTKFSEDPEVMKAAAEHLAKVQASKPVAQQSASSASTSKPITKLSVNEQWADIPNAAAAQSKIASWQQGTSGKLTSEQKSVLKGYTDGTYGTINNSLRDDDLSSSTLTLVHEMDSVFDSIEGIPEDIITHRGTHAEALTGEVTVGKTIYDKGFMSTSPTAPWSKNVILHIRLKKGSKALWGPTSGGDVTPGENEIILRRSSMLHVLQVEDVGGTQHIYVETYA